MPRLPIADHGDRTPWGRDLLVPGPRYKVDPGELEPRAVNWSDHAKLVEEREGPAWRCRRCTFEVDAAHSRLENLMDVHVKFCRDAPGSILARKMKRDVASARFLYGEDRAQEVRERYLEEIERRARA